MGKLTLLAVGGVFLALIFGFFIAYLNFFIFIKRKKKRLPKDMKERIEKSKIEIKEVENDRRFKKTASKKSGAGAGNRTTEFDNRAGESKGNSVNRPRVQLPIHIKNGRTKQTVELNRPAALSDFRNSF